MKVNFKTIVILTIAAIILGVVIKVITNLGDADTSRPKTDEELSLIHSLSNEDLSDRMDDVKTYPIEQKKFIKDIGIDKDPICAGQDFQVKVIANNIDGSDTELSYRIGNRAGNPVVIRYNKAGERAIHVFVRNLQQNVDHKRITVSVIDCPGVPTVQLKAYLSSKRADEAEFKVVKKSGLGENCKYTWDFNDGTPAKETATGFIVHNFGKRDQQSFSSTFTVSVTVTDEELNSASGRATITLPNIHWLSTKMGFPIIPFIYNRFPEESGSLYEVPVTIKNIYKEEIEFKDADVEFRSCISGKEKETKTYSTGTFLPTNAIPAGAIIDDTISFTKSQIPESTCGMLMQFKGTLKSGENGNRQS